MAPKASSDGGGAGARAGAGEALVAKAPAASAAESASLLGAPRGQFNQDKVSPEMTVNALLRYTYAWFWSLAVLGWRRPLGLITCLSTMTPLLISDPWPL